MLALDHITISLKGKTLIKPFSLRVAAGETALLMGPSGSGKSSLLGYIAGDLAESFAASGTITLDDRRLNELTPEQRKIGRLFQDDYLFPHMTVAENLLFAIPAMPDDQRQIMMRRALERAELSDYANRAPHTLSGGQRSRIALMRSLLAKPGAILLDEPFGKLDRALRATIRDYTFSHIKSRAIPALIVSHDAEDAPPGARILTIMPDGEISHV